jgi:serine/threonine-protein kinase PpkA
MDRAAREVGRLTDTRDRADADGVPGRFRVDFTGKTLLGMYRVLRRLGTGGMATVYLAENTTLGTKAVVKVPHAQFLVEEGFRERFSREIGGLVEIRHPHVVKILARGVEEDVPFFVLDHMAGGSLEDRLKEKPGGRQTLREVNAWLAPLASALDFVGARGLVHRDVKPGNILFDEHGTAVLSDFGIAKTLGRRDGTLTMTGMSLGTPQYMAPEQAMGQALTGAADQYALAATAYAALSGVAPFDGTTPLEVVVKKQQCEARPLEEVAPAVPPLAAAAVMRALAKDPAQRFSSCTEFARAFEEGVAGPPPKPPPTLAPTYRHPVPPPTVAGASTTSAPSSPRPRVPILVAAGALLLVGGAGVWFGLGLGGDDAPSTSPSAERPPGASGGATPLPPREVRVAIEEPAPDAFVPTRSVVVRGRVEGAAGATLNGSAVSPGADGRFETAVAATTDGPLDLVLAAGDTRAARSVVVDTTRPVIEIDAPRDASTTTRETSVTIRGRVVEANLDRLTVDGQALTPAAGGAFTWLVTLRERERRTVTFAARDRAGHEAAPVTREVVHELPPPPAALVPAWAAVGDLQKEAARRASLPVAFENPIGMRFVLVPAGTFTMGAPKAEEGRGGDESPFEATLTRPYYVQVTEVTNAHYRRFRPDHDSGLAAGGTLGGDTQPVVKVTWDDAVAFAAWLTGQDPARAYRLPTEAEWEHACRAGTRTPFWFGATISTSQANYDGKGTYGGGARGEYRRVTTPAGTFAANPWGLYDVHGNVWEWCQDWYGPYPAVAAENPAGPATGEMRILRGGSWYDPPTKLRSAFRNTAAPTASGGLAGFRLVVTPPSP